MFRAEHSSSTFEFRCSARNIRNGPLPDYHAELEDCLRRSAQTMDINHLLIALFLFQSFRLRSFQCERRNRSTRAKEQKKRPAKEARMHMRDRSHEPAK